MKSRNIKCIWLIAQGFLHRPDIDYKETYSSMMDTITFRYLICLAISERLDLCLMDVVTAYLDGSLDNDIYVKIPEGFQMPEVVKLVGYKWVFIRKYNEKNEITRYKVWLIAQGF